MSGTLSLENAGFMPPPVHPLCLNIPSSFNSVSWAGFPYRLHTRALDSSGLHPRPSGMTSSCPSAWTVHYTVIPATVKPTAPIIVLTPCPTPLSTSSWQMGVPPWHTIQHPCSSIRGSGVERTSKAWLSCSIPSQAPDSPTPKMSPFLLSGLTFPIRLAKYESEALALISKTLLNKPISLQALETWEALS